MNDRFSKKLYIGNDISVGVSDFVKYVCVNIWNKYIDCYNEDLSVYHKLVESNEILGEVKEFIYLDSNISQKDGTNSLSKSSIQQKEEIVYISWVI